MAEKNRHIIHRQSLDLQLSADSDGHEVQEAFSRLIKGKLQSILAELFDHYVEADELVRIDKLELNLGVIPKREMETVFIDRLVAQLSEQLHKAVHRNEMMGLKRMPLRQSQFEDWLVYLSSGILSRMVTQTPEEAIRENILDHLAVDNRAAGVLLKLLGQNEKATKRLVFQYGESFIQAILEKITQSKTTWLSLLYRELASLRKERSKWASEIRDKDTSSLLTGNVGSPTEALRWLFWKNVLDITHKKQKLPSVIEVIHLFWQIYLPRALSEAGKDELERHMRSYVETGKDRFLLLLQAIRQQPGVRLLPGEVRIDQIAVDEGGTTDAPEAKAEQLVRAEEEVAKKEEKTAAVKEKAMQEERAEQEIQLERQEDSRKDQTEVVEDQSLQNTRLELTQGSGAGDESQEQLGKTEEKLIYDLSDQADEEEGTAHSLESDDKKEERNLKEREESVGEQERQGALGIDKDHKEPPSEFPGMESPADTRIDRALEKESGQKEEQKEKDDRGDAIEKKQKTRDKTEKRQKTAKVEEKEPDSPKFHQELLDDEVQEKGGNQVSSIPSGKKEQQERPPTLSDEGAQERGRKMDQISSTLSEAKEQQDVPRSNELLSMSDFPEEGLMVPNAGVVILHSFLPTLFRNLGYVEGKVFKKEQYRHRSIHLIHWLATGEEEIPEHLLILPKFLCQLPFDVPLERKIEWQDIELEEGTAVLETVIKYWKALKSTSPDGLRDGFLRREGKLEKRSNGWYLMVERKTMDILLSRLPWGIGMIKLPWMDEMLRVEWI